MRGIRSVLLGIAMFDSLLDPFKSICFNLKHSDFGVGWSARVI